MKRTQMFALLLLLLVTISSCNESTRQATGPKNLDYREVQAYILSGKGRWLDIQRNYAIIKNSKHTDSLVYKADDSEVNYVFVDFKK